MKCDKLTIYDDQWYDKSEVDEAIAELKDELHGVDNQWNEQCKEIAELKAKNRVLQSFYDLHGNVDNYIDQLKAKLESVQASAYADSVDAGMRERRLRRALYKACAMWADRTRLICSVFGSNAPKIRWERMYEKCLAMAEKYK